MSDPEADQDALLRRLHSDMDLGELAWSIAAHSYFAHEPLYAEKAGESFVVLEGNRRLATVKLLRDRGLRDRLRVVGWPELTEDAIANLDELPVIVTTRADLWQYVGFRHVSGAQRWTSYSKAIYVARVHKTYGQGLDAIARQMGDSHDTVKRLYRAYMVVEQAESEGVFSRGDCYAGGFYFSHLSTALELAGYKDFLGLGGDRDYESPRPVPVKSRGKLGKMLMWLYGSKEQDVRPLVVRQAPDLHRLNRLLQDERGRKAILGGASLAIAESASVSDEAALLTALLTAKRYLEAANGKVTNGYHGQPEVLEVAEDSLRLAEAIHAAMTNVAATSAAGTASRTPAGRPRGKRA